MKMALGGTEFEVNGSFLFTALIMLAAIAIPVSVILFGVVPNAGAAGDKSFDAYYSAVTGILGVIAGPLVAGALVLGMGLFKIDKGPSTSASLAASAFVIYAAVIAGFFLLSVSASPAGAGKAALGAISTILQAAAGTIVIFLWMLIFIKPDTKRLGQIVPYALAFAVVVFLAGRLLLLALSGGGQYQLSFDLASLAVIAAWFLNGTAILYSTRGKGLDMDAAYTYAALVLADGLIYGLVDKNMVLLGSLSRFAVLAEALAALVILYVLSRPEKTGRTAEGKATRTDKTLGK